MRDPRVLGGVAAALVVVVLGWFVLLRGDQPGSAATGAAAEQAAGGTPAAGAGTPAASGEAGQEARATPTGELVAWTAAFDVVTRPAGARVVIDGVAVDGLTPLQIELDSQTRYDIRIGLEGYEPVRWAFTPGELPEATQASRRLYFPLTAMEAASAIASPTRSGSEVPAAPPAPGADMDGVERPVEPPSTPRGRDESPLDPIRVSGARMTAPTVLEKVDPEFPDWARDAGLPTYVLLQLIIDRNGSLRSSQVLRPVHPDLERVALKVVQQWRFAPATRDGEPVDAYFNVSVTFVRE